MQHHGIRNWCTTTELMSMEMLLSYFEGVDWLDELRLLATACLLAAALVPATLYLWVKCFGDGPGISLPIFSHWAILRPRPAIRTGPIVGRVAPRIDPALLPPPRVEVSASGVRVFGYPSVDDGTIGFIALEDAAPADFAYLGLDRCRLPERRHLDQGDEDAFCTRMLSLGAQAWNDSDHFGFVMEFLDGDDKAVQQIARGETATPSAEELRWVSVAWPSTGGVWVAEVQRRSASVLDGTFHRPTQQDILEERGRLKLATDMDEKSTLLAECFRAKFYQDPKKYGGDAFLPC